MNLKGLIRGEIEQSDLLNWQNATVLYDRLPYSINGFVYNYDGIYFIIINKALSYYKKRKTILHELAHIEKNQLCQSDNDMLEFHRQDYEDEADLYIREITEELKK